MRRTQLSLLMVLFSVPALAQTDGTYLLTSSNEVSPSFPTTTISIWATWVDPGTLFVFIGGDYDLTAGDGQFSNPVNVLHGPGSSTGVIAGSVISGAANGQIHIIPSFPGSMDNPILLATYDWTTTDFTPRSVSLDTSNTTTFLVAWFTTGPGGGPPGGTIISLFPQNFTAGTGVIRVVPSPASATPMLVLGAVILRRRRPT